jgi:hypothetical protein
LSWYLGKISDLKGKTVMFEDGSSVEADAIVVCAGHTFDLSFFSKERQPLQK